MSSDNQVSSGQVNEPPRSPLKLLVIIALMLAALLAFGALDH